jgi:hypothetical protein
MVPTVHDVHRFVETAQTTLFMRCGYCRVASTNVLHPRKFLDANYPALPCLVPATPESGNLNSRTLSIASIGGAPGTRSTVASEACEELSWPHVQSGRHCTCSLEEIEGRLFRHLTAYGKQGQTSNCDWETLTQRAPEAVSTLATGLASVPAGSRWVFSEMKDVRTALVETVSDSCDRADPA